MENNNKQWTEPGRLFTNEEGRLYLPVNLELDIFKDVPEAPKVISSNPEVPEVLSGNIQAIMKLKVAEKYKRKLDEFDVVSYFSVEGTRVVVVMCLLEKGYEAEWMKLFPKWVN